MIKEKIMKIFKKLLFLILVSIICSQAIISEDQKKFFIATNFASPLTPLQENYQQIKKNINDYTNKFKNFGKEFYEKIQEYKKYLVKQYRTTKGQAKKFIKEFQEQSAAMERISKNGSRSIIQEPSTSYSYIELNTPPEEVSKQLVTLDSPQEIVLEKQKIIDETDDIVKKLLKEYPYPLRISDPSLKEVYIQETESYNNAIKFFKEQIENGSYLKRPLKNIENNLFALTNFAKELKKLKKEGYKFQQNKALEMPKTLVLESPKPLEIKKAEIKHFAENKTITPEIQKTQEVKIKTPEQIEYEDAFLNVPLAYEMKEKTIEEKIFLLEDQYKNYESILKNLKNIPFTINKNIKTNTKKFKQIKDVSDKIFFNLIDQAMQTSALFNQISKTKIDAKTNSALEAKFTELIKNTIEIFNNIIKKFAEFNEMLPSVAARKTEWEPGEKKEINEKQRENIQIKKQTVDLIFISLTRNAILPFIQLLGKNKIFITEQIYNTLLDLKKGINDHSWYTENVSGWEFIKGLSDQESILYENTKDNGINALNTLLQDPTLIKKYQKRWFSIPKFF